MPPVVAAILGVAVLLALLAPSAASGGGKRGGCGGAGDAEPQQLSNGEARDAVLCLINGERNQRGLPDLQRDRKLQKAAQRHSERMDGTGCFSHECPGEAALGTRLGSVDYLGGAVERWAFGENIAWGMRSLGTPRAIVDAWMRSAGHRANILSTSFREIGVGFASGSPNGKRDPGGIYTTDFGLAIR